jgi:DNA-directed RNA polymerase
VIEMRARRFNTGIAAVLLALAGFASAEGQELKLPAYERVEFDNGLELFLLRRATIPMISIELWIDVGSTADPMGQAGLAMATADALRKGAGKLDAAEFAEALDQLGADFSTSVDAERTRVSMDFLTKDLDASFALFSDALLRPSFDAAETEKLTAQMAENVTQAKDNPRNVLGNYHAAQLFGTHPYGNPSRGTEESFAHIDAQTLRRFHRDHYGADRMIMTVAGDIDVAKMRALVTASFGKHARAAAERVSIAPPEEVAGREVLLVNKVDTPQTWFIIGGMGPSWGDPDYAATELVRTIFGGRFTSWLNQELRINSGLSYGARFGIRRFREGGSASISSFTATETTKQALDLALATLDRLHDEGIGSEDLQSAKAYLKGQRPYDYETASDLAAAICHIEFYDLGRAHVDDLFAMIDAVTPEDCRRVVETYFGRENLRITCIGVASEVQDILANYGALTVRENSDVGFHAAGATSTLNR